MKLIKNKRKIFKNGLKKCETKTKEKEKRKIKKKVKVKNLFTIFNLDCVALSCYIYFYMHIIRHLYLHHIPHCLITSVNIYNSF